MKLEEMRKYINYLADKYPPSTEVMVMGCYQSVGGIEWIGYIDNEDNLCPGGSKILVASDVCSG